MRITIDSRTLQATCAACAMATLLVACGKPDAPAASTSTATSQGTVPPPPGDSTPKPADAQTANREANGANEKTGTSQPQTTVGSAAAGAPPYTLNGAPEGNVAPSQGTKSDAAPKK